MNDILTVAVLDDTGTYQIEVTVTPQLNDGLDCSTLTVRQIPGGPPITGDRLRHIRVTEIVHRAIAGHEAAPKIPEVTPQEAQRLRKSGPTDEALQHVVAVYSAALATKIPPTAAVQSSLGLPRSTTGRWIAIARKRGLLAPSRGQGRAG